MNAERLLRADGTPTDIWCCTKCGLVHAAAVFGGDAVLARLAAHEMATNCCTEAKCCLCQTGLGRTVNKGGVTACASCRAKERKLADQKEIDRARRITIDELDRDEPLFCDDEHFFYGIDEVIEWASDLSADRFPLAVWRCETKKPEIDIDRFFDDFSENLDLNNDTSIGDVCEGIDELKSFMASWNERQKPSIWYPSRKEVLVLQRSDVKQEE